MLRCILRISILCAAALVCLSGSGLAEGRRAFLMGIGHYTGDAALKNPTNDASNLGDALRSLGFEAQVEQNASRENFIGSLTKWSHSVQPSDTLVFFFAGHGVAFEGENYLIPEDFPRIDAGRMSDVDLSDALRSLLSVHAVKLSTILEVMVGAGAQSGFVFIDACRNMPGGTSNPVISKGRSPSSFMRGLVSVKMNSDSAKNYRGIMRVYATEPNSVASDGKGQNSPFTTALLAHIKTEGLSFDELMRRVTKTVLRITDDKQVPWLEGVATTAFYFVPPVRKNNPVKPSNSQTPSSKPSPTQQAPALPPGTFSFGTGGAP